MSRTVLITGSTGMVGRNASEMLIEKGFKILTPTRSELDLMDSVEVMRYFEVEPNRHCSSRCWFSWRNSSQY